MPTIDKSIGAYHDSSNARIRKIGGYTGPASYVTGGDPITPGDLGMSRIEMILFSHGDQRHDLPLPGLEPQHRDRRREGQVARRYDRRRGRAGAVNLSTYFARFEAIGK